MAHLICTGRIGNDAETRELQSGKKVVSFSLADDIGWGDKKRTIWLKCAMFGDRAEKVAPYLTKGSIVQIHGEPESEAWIKDGEAKSTIKVLVSDVKLFGGGQRADLPIATDTDASKAKRGAAPAGQGFDDDIPFAPEWR